MPNIAPEKPNRPLVKPSFAALSGLANTHDTHEKALKALSDAQEELAAIKDARNEERVGWMVISVILFDCALFLNAENATAPVIIGILEIAMLALVAKRLGVEEFYALFSKAMHRFVGMASGDKE
ncbi:hypothetical protein [uncultured Novosphingobium sp.]|uniref:hypothetical protein n=1 Tax=uncultured Novosphingobium sp. TaxID=292277 RepID=UPI003747CD77